MIKWNSIKELVKGTQDDTQHKNNAHQKKTSSIDCDRVQLHSVTWYLHPHNYKKNPEKNITEINIWNQERITML